MIEIPIDDAERTLVAFVRNWFTLLAAGRSQEACNMIDEPNYYGIAWTPEQIQQVVAGAFGPQSRFRLRHPEGIRCTDPEELSEGGNPEVYPSHDGGHYRFDHDVPLNGEWSDLTAQFEFHRRQKGYVVVLHDLHVL